MIGSWAEARARQDLAMAPDGARVFLATHIAAGDAAGRNPPQMQGMTETRHAWQMEIDLDRRPDAPHWPDGITVRARRPGEERAIYTTERTAFKDHWGYMEEPFEEGFAW